MPLSRSPDASSAGKVEAKRSPPGTGARYSGLMPRRSRPSSTLPLSRSQIAKANMPCRRRTKLGPQAWYALMSTSVSPLEWNL